MQRNRQLGTIVVKCASILANCVVGGHNASIVSWYSLLNRTIQLQIFWADLFLCVDLLLSASTEKNNKIITEQAIQKFLVGNSSVIDCHNTAKNLTSTLSVKLNSKRHVRNFSNFFANSSSSLAFVAHWTLLWNFFNPVGMWDKIPWHPIHYLRSLLPEENRRLDPVRHLWLY